MKTTTRFDELLRRQRTNLTAFSIVGVLFSAQLVWAAATLF